MIKWTWGGLLNASFSNEFQQGYIETNPDAGVPFRRLVFSDIQDIVKGNISLTNSDYLAFMSWYKVAIKQGTIPFEMYDCRVKADRVARLTIDKPQFNRDSNRWLISCTITYDSGVFFFDRLLLVNKDNNDAYLMANGKRLVGAVSRYL